MFNRASQTSRFICRVQILAFHWQNLACLVSLVVWGKLLLLFILVPPMLGSNFSPLAVFFESFFFWNTIFCDCKLRANKSRSNSISWSASSTACFSVLLSVWLPDYLLGANIYYHKNICQQSEVPTAKNIDFVIPTKGNGLSFFEVKRSENLLPLDINKFTILYAMSRNLTK